ncbi:MAG TPA: SRPBCC family protein [Egibacteraceae bacterium]|jgi:hypothetical protein|nr:SRPBCC family protein [Egibacteraceae bacterium]
MVVRLELYATGGAPPEDTWAVVSDLRRLPEWTDAEEVERVEPEPVAPGTEFVVVRGDDRRLWRVMTAEPRLLEVTTQTPRGPLAIGVRVVRDPYGSRLVLAGAYDPPCRRDALRVRAIDAPALRRRFDRWSRAALRLAAAVR